MTTKVTGRPEMSITAVMAGASSPRCHEGEGRGMGLGWGWDGDGLQGLD